MISALLFSACGYIANTRFGYEPPRLQESRTSHLIIAVEPLRDVRGTRSYPSLQGRVFLLYVPFIPYIKIPYERLDESLALSQQRRGQEPPDSDLLPALITATLAADVLKSGLASDSFVVRAGEISRPAHVLLSGELRSTEFDVYRTAYMLGPVGVLLWFLPIPLGGTTAHVDASLLLLDTNRREIWSCAAVGMSRSITTLYNAENTASTFSRFRVKVPHFGRNAKGIDPDSVWSYHSDALRSAMVRCSQSLAGFLSTYSAGEPISFTQQANNAEVPSAERRLRELKSLLEQRLISPDDYERRKSTILDEM